LKSAAGGTETDSSVKDIYFKIESSEPIQISSDVNVAESVAQNFGASYSTNTLELSLTWDKPRYFDENSPVLTYKITDSSYLVSSSTLVLPEINTSATSTIITISEVGRKYKFSIQAFTDSGTSTLTALSEDIFIPYSLLSQFVIAGQSDYSVSEVGTGNGEFYQTVGNNLSGDLGAIAIKFSGPTGHYLSVYLYQYADSSYSNAENILYDAVFCTNRPGPGEINYPSPLCSDYYLDSNTVTIPVRNNFTFNPEKYYKLFFITHQSQSTFYGSGDENSYSNGQATKNSGGNEIPTNSIKDVYFKILSAISL
ncbi:fibronectin type III domain-containing protein, partial [Patescibacteria group bacterium]|nr:fibronectin type III domain-containing protein [Patescibacteria group bacterium]